MPNEKTQSWDRLLEERETSNAYKSFCAFRNAGSKRNLVEVYRKETGRKQATQASGQWLTWYTRFRWRERAQAWDDFIERQERQQHLEKLKKFRSDYAKTAQLVLGKAVAFFSRMEPEEFTPAMAIKAIEMSYKTGISALGDITPYEENANETESMKKDEIRLIDRFEAIVKKRTEEGKI